MSAGVAVFTYGSLMFEAVMHRVVRGRYASIPARLAGFRRLAIRGEAYPAVVPGDGDGVTGRLWLAVSADDVVRLDRFEGHEYQRRTVRVRPRSPDGAEAGPVDAQCYVWLDPARLRDAPWDEAGFVRDHLHDFAIRHGGAAGDAAPGPQAPPD